MFLFPLDNFVAIHEEFAVDGFIHSAIHDTPSAFLPLDIGVALRKVAKSQESYILFNLS